MTPRPRRAQFALNDDGDDDSEREETRASRPVPVIVVQDAQTPPSRDTPRLGEEEKHVGFAPAALVDGQDESVKGRDEEGLTYPPSSPPKKDEKTGFESSKFKESDPDTPKTLKNRLPPLPSALAWITPHLNWKGFRPVVRASVAAWCGLILSAFSLPALPLSPY